MRPRTWTFLIVAVLLSVALSVAVGAVALSVGEVWTGLRGAADASTNAIVRDVRLPRTALAALVGAALGLSGMTLQASLRNALAEPYLLGVSGGAAVGAVLASAFGVVAIGGVSAAAFVGAAVAIVLVFSVASAMGRGRDPAMLLMAGVVIGAFANAVIMIALARATPTAQRNALWWMMGSVSAASWSDVAWLGASVLVFGAVLLHRARELDVLSLGADAAAALGVGAGASVKRLFGVASLLAAATVATAGLIGFVGLIVPHLARGLARATTARATAVASMCLGAVLVILADVAARTVLAPSELPLGAVTALVGVPFFLSRLRAVR